MQPPPPPDGIYIKKEESDASSSSLASSLHSHSDGIQKGGIPPATNCVSTYRTHPTKYEFETEPPSIVVYIVDPFTYQRDRNADTQRLATIGLLRSVPRGCSQERISLSVSEFSRTLELSLDGWCLNVCIDVDGCFFAMKVRWLNRCNDDG